MASSCTAEARGCCSLGRQMRCYTLPCWWPGSVQRLGLRWGIWLWLLAWGKLPTLLSMRNNPPLSGKRAPSLLPPR